MKRLYVKYRLRHLFLKRGIWQFGHDGKHHGRGMKPDCPRMLHHHHDEFCAMPRTWELLFAGIKPKDFQIRSRR